MAGAWELVGEVGVDAGIVMVGDPCYIDDKEHPVHNWSAFCGLLQGYATQLNYPKGRKGLGVVVQSGYGDGVYPVYVKKREDGTVKSLKVKF